MAFIRYDVSITDFHIQILFIMLIGFVQKMLFAYYICYIFKCTRNLFYHMNPDQTAFIGAVSLESACIFPFSFRGATPQLSFLRDLLKDQSLPCWSKSNDVFHMLPFS